MCGSLGLIQCECKAMLAPKHITLVMNGMTVNHNWNPHLFICMPYRDPLCEIGILIEDRHLNPLISFVPLSYLVQSMKNTVAAFFQTSSVFPSQEMHLKLTCLLFNQETCVYENHYWTIKRILCEKLSCKYSFNSNFIFHCLHYFLN